MGPKHVITQVNILSQQMALRPVPMAIPQVEHQSVLGGEPFITRRHQELYDGSTKPFFAAHN